MKSKLTAQVLLSAIALSAAVVSPAMAQYNGPYQQGIPNPYPQGIPGPYQQGIPNPYPQGIPGPYPQGIPGPYPQGIPRPYPQPTTSSSTSFVCGQAGGYPATFVQAGGRVLPSPLIVWETASSNLSPQERCQMVSQRMTFTVAQNGGRLSNLMLTTGKVNGYPVICFVNNAETCNANNVILTLLRGENARNPGNVLARIIRFGGSAGSSGGFREVGGIEGGGSSEIIPTAISLEEAVNQLANEAGGMPAAPNPDFSAPAPAPGAGGNGPI